MTRAAILSGDAICLQSVGKVFPAHIGLVKWLRQAPPITALRGIELRAARGEVVALMGPNGSGKSTLLKLVAATLFPEAGRILVLGFDTAVEPMRVRREVSLAVAQERSFFPRLTARENLSFFAALENVPHAHRRAHIAWALEQTGLAALGERYVHQFSSGMYQRLALARALLKQPAVLLLDEPTRSADPETSVLLRRFVRTLAGGGTTVLLATHSFEEAAMLADSAVLLMGGRIVDRLRRPDVHSLRSAYACLSPAAQPASDEVWEQCLT